jgi:hypothetical protein
MWPSGALQWLLKTESVSVDKMYFEAFPIEQNLNILEKWCFKRHCKVSPTVLHVIRKILNRDRNRDLIEIPIFFATIIFMSYMNDM